MSYKLSSKLGQAFLAPSYLYSNGNIIRLPQTLPKFSMRFPDLPGFVNDPGFTSFPAPVAPGSPSGASAVLQGGAIAGLITAAVQILGALFGGRNGKARRAAKISGELATSRQILSQIRTDKDLIRFMKIYVQDVNATGHATGGPTCRQSTSGRACATAACEIAKSLGYSGSFACNPYDGAVTASAQLSIRNFFVAQLEQLSLAAQPVSRVPYPSPYPQIPGPALPKLQPTGLAGVFSSANAPLLIGLGLVLAAVASLSSD